MIILYILILIILLFVITINLIIIFSTHRQILKKDYSKLKNIDCILVLGAGVIDNSRPTLMLRDRINESVRLYQKHLAPKIIMSGDHGRKDYDEVNIMKGFAIKTGVPSEDIFMDHAGFNSYDSIYRAKEIFGAKRIIIVTQKYHLYRSLYIANKLGLESYGSKADVRIYPKMPIYWLREVLARVKNIFKCKARPKPKFLGDKISLRQSGDVTNDK